MSLGKCPGVHVRGGYVLEPSSTAQQRAVYYMGNIGMRRGGKRSEGLRVWGDTQILNGQPCQTAVWCRSGEWQQRRASSYFKGKRKGSQLQTKNI